MSMRQSIPNDPNKGRHPIFRPGSASLPATPAPTRRKPSGADIGEQLTNYMLALHKKSKKKGR